MIPDLIISMVLIAFIVYTVTLIIGIWQFKRQLDRAKRK